MRLCNRFFLAVFALIVSSVAVAYTDGIHNPSANSVGNLEGIDSNAATGVAALACSYTPVTTGTQNVAYTGATPAASGGVLAYTFSETGALPTGLTINSGTGVISGTPSVSGSFTNIQVKVTDSTLTVANCGTAFTLTIASAFQGAGDIVAGATSWGSCARVYTAAQASTATSLCDLKDKTTGTVAICTLRGSSTGFVDLAGTYCTGSTTPAAACAAAAGGSCIVSKVYDQTVNGNHFTQATVGLMPGLLFSALGGLPGMTGLTANSTQLPTGNITVAQPLTMSVVALKTGSTAAGGILANPNAATRIGFVTGPNQMEFNGGTGVTVAATDGSFHAMTGVFNGASGAYNIDGTDVTSQNFGAGGFAAAPIRFFRNNGGATMSGTIMEGGVWPSAFTTQNRTDMNTNQHSLANGYNF